MDFKAPFLGAVDQGTSSSRFIIFDVDGKVVTSSQQEFDPICPEASWVEHDPEVLITTVRACIKEAAELFTQKELSISDIKGVGITNQRETIVCWDKNTHQPYYNAIVWCDGRTQALVEKYSEDYKKKELQKISGLPLSTYFSALKIRWLIDNVPSVKKALDEDTLLVGTVDSWLIYRCSLDGDCPPIHVTDASNASRTNLMNLATLQWDETLLKFFDIPVSILPKIVSSSEVYCHFPAGNVLAGVPVAGCLGDQQAAFVGQKCFEKGSVKNTYGTGCFMLYNTGTKPKLSHNGLLSTVGYRFGKEPPVYALEGSIANAGSAVKWLRDNLGIIEKASDIGDLADQVKDTGGVHFIPAFSGLLAPYWRPDARGAILGLTQFADKRHISRAALESICFQTRAIIEAMEKDSGISVHQLKVDGGLTNSDVCMQLQADLLGIQVERPVMRETSALGAALAAGLATKVFNSIDDFQPVNQQSITCFIPKISQEESESRYQAWNKSISVLLD